MTHYFWDQYFPQILINFPITPFHTFTVTVLSLTSPTSANSQLILWSAGSVLGLLQEREENSTYPPSCIFLQLPEARVQMHFAIASQFFWGFFFFLNFIRNKFEKTHIMESCPHSPEKILTRCHPINFYVKKKIFASISGTLPPPIGNILLTGQKLVHCTSPSAQNNTFFGVLKF